MKREAKELRCPECGSLEVYATFPPMGQGAGPISGIGIVKEEYRCDKCGELYWYHTKLCFVKGFGYLTLHYSDEESKLLCMDIESDPSTIEVEGLDSVWMNDKELFYTTNLDNVTCHDCLREIMRRKYGRKQ